MDIVEEELQTRGQAAGLYRSVVADWWYLVVVLRDCVCFCGKIPRLGDAVVRSRRAGLVGWGLSVKAKGCYELGDRHLGSLWLVGCALCMAAAQVKEGHLVDALARRGDEGRGTLRQASGSWEQALIRRYPNGETRPFKGHRTVNT